MKPAEAKVLEGLRKTTLAYLSDKQYAEVVEAVEKQGILGLTGAASRLVKGAVIKHGSHDQKTHGRKGGGGGGGGGSQVDAKESKQVQATVESAVDKMDSAIDSAKNDVDGFIRDSETQKEAKQFESIKSTLESASKDFKEAKSLTGNKQRAKLQSGYNKYENATSKLINMEDYSSKMRTDWAAQSMFDNLPQDELQLLGLEGVWDQ